MGNTPRDPATKGRSPIEIVSFRHSFETGEAGACKIYFPFKVQIVRIRTIVTKALAATDAGTITGANSTGNSTGGVVTIPLSSVLGTEVTVTPTTNNVVNAGDFYNLTSAKVTAGGKVNGTVEYARIQ